MRSTALIAVFVLGCQADPIFDFVAQCHMGDAIVDGAKTYYPFTARVGDFCSAAVISPYHVITAGHCVECKGTCIETENFKVQIGTRKHASRGIKRHSTVDIAVVWLWDSTSTIPLKIAHVEPVADESVGIFGYGLDWTYGSDGIQHGAVAKIHKIESDTILLKDLPNICFGDSGGPMINVRCELIAIHSKSSHACWEWGGSVRTDMYRSWILKAMEELQANGRN
jgi:V8-like Glu-specific endopeptidase